MLTDRIPSKADIRLIRSLGQKKFRQEHGLFVVEGEKMVGEALTQKRYQVEAVYRTSDIGEETMGRMSHLSSPSPALAVLRIPTDGIPDRASALPSGLCLGLDSVRDPGNVGTILRLADWFGIETVYLSPDCADPYRPRWAPSSDRKPLLATWCILPGTAVQQAYRSIPQPLKEEKTSAQCH